MKRPARNNFRDCDGGKKRGIQMWGGEVKTSHDHFSSNPKGAERRSEGREEDRGHLNVRRLLLYLQDEKSNYFRFSL